MNPALGRTCVLRGVRQSEVSRDMIRTVSSARPTARNRARCSPGVGCQLFKHLERILRANPNTAEVRKHFLSVTIDNTRVTITTHVSP